MIEREVSFSVSVTESRLITKIARRAAELIPTSDFISLEMDITAVHANGCELELERMLAASDLDFSHDIHGIRRNLNRKTGELENYFLPRFAARR